MLENLLIQFEKLLEEALECPLGNEDIEESGVVVSLDRGIAIVNGLSGVKNQELVRFPGDVMGMVYNLDPDDIGVILLGGYEHIKAGDAVTRTDRVVAIPVSEDFLGRVINPLGEILDGRGAVLANSWFPIEREAPPIMHRAPITEPLQTGIKVVDAAVPIGKGQRELILGDRQTGKTAIAIDAIINQKGKEVICIYCSIGQQISSVTKVMNVLKNNDALSHTILMVAGSEDPPGLAYIAPYAATSLGEYFMGKGKDVLIVYDDLTKHARSYRELSLLLERPPGREAYPGDIFYIHSRLLERATHLKKEYGGGSITALPIIETQAENLAAYIPTNLISITDGQIYVSPKIFQMGNLPAVNIGASVSRVGGKTQLPAYRQVTSALKLTYSQFEELEIFASFSARLDDATKLILERGYRIRKILNQPQYSPMDVMEQIGVFLAVVNGALDFLPLEKMEEAEEIIRMLVKEDEGFRKSIEKGEKIEGEKREEFLKRVVEKIRKEMVIEG
ncbi:F-type H+-transporting ATPase subunit alpha [Trichococcus patagoniensis]|uniref:ATP synthase subunit alpha n=1 Tax=Trichococcus patagoniensis TaxID=382641 RepID=A0A2T5IPQ9_9LACT|nr:F0F1 ATP synthase subunit alpha [Trichococcus patagoniensis]PTQ85805.1 F-type H+-transporting ATPase subunit alpha [Trichococcus patagoniensis]